MNLSGVDLAILGGTIVALLAFIVGLFAGAGMVRRALSSRSDKSIRTSVDVAELLHLVLHEVAAWRRESRKATTALPPERKQKSHRR